MLSLLERLFQTSSTFCYPCSTDFRIAQWIWIKLINRISGLEKDRLNKITTNTTSQLDHGDSLGMDGTQVGIFKQSNQTSFAGFLQGHNSGTLETQISFEILSDLTDQMLEGQFAYQ